MGDLVNVTIKVTNGKSYSIQMEKGVSFENNGGIYKIGQDGKLLKFDKKNNIWSNTNNIQMTDYQYKAFKNIANNDGKDNTFTKKDITEAQKLYQNGNFKTDMSNDLPSGYKIERSELKTQAKSGEDSVSAYVSNGNNTQSATLKFKIEADNKIQSSGNSTSTSKPQETTGTQGAKPRATTVSKEDMAILAPNGGDKFIYNEECGESRNLPLPVFTCEDSNESAKMIEKLQALSGQSITPDLIDKIVNIILDAKIAGADLIWGGDYAETTSSPMEDLARFAEYLKPATLDKILDTFIYLARSKKDENVKDMQVFYNRLSPAQKDKYYKELLSVGANSITGSSMDTWQAPGDMLADYIFEKPISAKTYTKLKSFVKDINSEDNGVLRSRTECKKLIETLKSRGQITEAQAQELRKAAGLK